MAVRRDVYETLDEAVYADMGRTLYGAMCEAMYSERHEQHTYADAFLLHCQHAE
jgi:serine phosphatase RsbU (regulator of sigma subunit)